MVFRSIFEDSKASYLIENKGLPKVFAQVLRISQLYKRFSVTLLRGFQKQLELKKKYLKGKVLKELLKDANKFSSCTFWIIE